MRRSRFLTVLEWRRNRDRSRRIARMLERERATVAAEIDWVDAMALQLEEIRALPEVVESSR
jgi:hypothetical protein